jgi:hypothetical protein
MSAMTRHSDRAAGRLPARRTRLAGRARRAEAGTVTEMARSLLRESGGAGLGRDRPLARLQRSDCSQAGARPVAQAA